MIIPSTSWTWAPAHNRPRSFSHSRRAACLSPASVNAMKTASATATTQSSSTETSPTRSGSPGACGPFRCCCQHTEQFWSLVNAAYVYQHTGALLRFHFTVDSSPKQCWLAISWPLKRAPRMQLSFVRRDAATPTERFRDMLGAAVLTLWLWSGT